MNIMRICQPSDRATLEFRQFPGGDFNQPLLIWGWVKFLGLLVTHACACADGVSPFPAEGSEEEGVKGGMKNPWLCWVDNV